MKIIQTQFKSLLFLLFIGLAFTGCSSDDEGDPDPQGDLPPVILACDAFQTGNPNPVLLLNNVNDGVDYIIDCVVSVEVDLVIEPGVVIQFSDAAGMKIRDQGSISAVGTQNNPITFTSAAAIKGAWKGILSFSEKIKNRFEYVTLENAGDGGLTSNSEPASLILAADTYFRLNHVTVKNGLKNGIAATAYNYNLEINNTTVTGCDIPLYVEPNVAAHISGGNFTGNTSDVIRIAAGYLEDGGAHTWKNLAVPYRMAADLVIVGGTTLTLEPGLVMEFEDTKGMEMDKLFNDGSALIAVGTPSNPITFTGVTKAPGAWHSLSFRRSTSVQNKLEHVLIEYAGGAGAGGAIEMWVDPVLSVTNTTFKDIDACALFTKYNPTNPNLTESNNTLINVSGGYMCHD